MEFTSRENEWSVVVVETGMEVVLIVNGAYAGEYTVVGDVTKDSITLSWIEDGEEIESEITNFAVEWDTMYKQPRIYIEIEPAEVADPDVLHDSISDHHWQ